MKKQPGATLTPLAMAVLALLEERPMHPYEMYQLLLQRREDYLVKIRPGSLYHTVSRLAEQELVRAEGTDRAGNRPERTTYRITEPGTTALRTRIADIIRHPIREFPIFPLAMSEAHNLPKDEVVALIRERVGVLDGELTELDALHDWLTTHQVPRRYWMVIEYLRGQLDAELVWLRRIAVDMESGALEWEEFTADGSRASLPADNDQLGHGWGAAVTDDVLAELRKGGVLPADH
ncbi:DNA-binding PadR family transcriptional regulator [Nocardia transvalensis]|uniref:DNA-binding PadR family transcriptional regulator n=1 Tax=Nocardia transvalensis TaxID=37333 RepID=A0A7W9PAB8_9NOCA|nr:PadR family transcriptional regulator [Nocardia transvalensis]MBB5912416.1 DNA-binding PadR family transcriptional regulator [Nocardia transvalensis]